MCVGAAPLALVPGGAGGSPSPAPPCRQGDGGRGAARTCPRSRSRSRNDSPPALVPVPPAAQGGACKQRLGRACPRPPRPAPPTSFRGSAGPGESKPAAATSRRCFLPAKRARPSLHLASPALETRLSAAAAAGRSQEPEPGVTAAGRASAQGVGALPRAR